MVKVLRTLVILTLVSSVFAQQPPAQQQQKPADVADLIAYRAIDALGGAAWPQARYFAFTFIVERDGKVVSSFPQRWDRLTGDYRVSGADPQGNPFDVVMNLNSKKARATLNGAAVTDPAKLKDIVENIATRRFINDVFWLLMPLRMTDQGVKREYIGTRDDSCGRIWDVLKLTFEQGGLLPGETYWAWVNRDTGIVDEWDMKLQANAERPTEIIFHDFRRAGGLLISTRREVKKGSQFVRLENLQVLPATPRGAFQ